MADSAKVLETALSLSTKDRARLAHKLIASLDDKNDPDAATLWVNELVRRSQAIENGSATLIDSDDVHADMAARLRELRS